MKCPNCKNEIPSGSRFCNQCGQKIEISNNQCPYCLRTNLPSDAIFCPDCGTKIISEIRSSENERTEIKPTLDLSIVWADLKNGYYIDPRDDQQYKIVKIGNQVWMAENLRYKTPYGCWAFKNNDLNVNLYGYLYSWEAAKIASPEGWHLPTDEDWKKMETGLGMSGSDLEKLGAANSRGIGIGSKLKSRSGWSSGNGNNQSGFNAIPALYYERNKPGETAFFWSGTRDADNQAFVRFVSRWDDTITRLVFPLSEGASIRLIKD